MPDDFEPMSWKDVADHLKAKGWTVEYRPLSVLPAYRWFPPGGTDRGFYSNHPDAPSEDVMQEAYKRGDVNFTWIVKA